MRAFWGILGFLIASYAAIYYWIAVYHTPPADAPMPTMTPSLPSVMSGLDNAEPARTARAFRPVLEERLGMTS